MLSDDEKAKIFEEEKIRLAAQRESHYRFQFLVRILNSPFIIFFLGSIVIAFISHQYSESQKENLKEQQTSSEVKELELEIKYRTDIIGRVAKPWERTRRIWIANRAISGNHEYLFKKYKEERLLALIWKLQSLYTDNDKKKLVSNLNSSFNEWTKLSEKIGDGVFSLDEINQDDRKKLVELSQQIGGWVKDNKQIHPTPNDGAAD